MTIYDIPELVNEAQLSAIVPRNIISGFRNTGIYPYNRDIFNETDYVPSAITDRELSEEPNANVAEPNANAAEPNANAAEPNSNAAEPNANAAESNADTAEPNANAAEPNSNAAEPNANAAESNAGAAEPVQSTSYVSPAHIIPLPKAGPQKANVSAQRPHQNSYRYSGTRRYCGRTGGSQAE